MDPVDLTPSLRAAQAGDEVAMAGLFRALNPPLLRYLRHRAPDVAEDLASECWLALAKVLATFPGEADDLRAWLFGVARRQVANHWRGRSRQPQFVRDEPPLEALSVPDAADVVVAAMSAQEAIETLLHGLPDEHAEIVLLRVVAGLSVEQVAELLGKRPGAVRVTQHRVLRRLAARLEQRPVTR